MKKISHQVFRLSKSSYHRSEFFETEAKTLETLAGIKYVHDFKDLDPKIPLILISNSETKGSDLQSLEMSHYTFALMIHPNSGYDNFQAKFAAQAPFPIILGNPIRAQGVAEFILGAVFSHFCTKSSQGKWQREWNRHLLCSRQIQIIGHGHIGQILNTVLLPLCPQIKIFDPFKNLLQLDPSSDIILLAASLNPSSHHLINAEFLAKASPELLLVNAARGAIVDLPPLVTFLSQNPKAKAFIDVFEEEPLKFSDYKKNKNLAVTSHLAGLHTQLNAEILSFEKQVIADYLENLGQPKNFHTLYKNLLLSEKIIQGELV
jgi:phosphoglycerate dehydrogenase-like enzyme